MGRMKEIAIDLMEQPDQDCPNDAEMLMLLDNFKPTPEEQAELQAELDELQAHAVSYPAISVGDEQTVYLLMRNGRPYRAYTDKALAFYECWVCTAGEAFAEEAVDWFVQDLTLDKSTYEGE